MTYTAHARFSFYLSLLFARASLQAMIHAVVPRFFIMSSTRNTQHVMSLLEQSGCARGQPKPPHRDNETQTDEDKVDAQASRAGKHAVSACMVQ